MKKLNSKFWSNQYKTNNIGWDTGAITTPLKEYINQLNDKNAKILIPGAGNSYEAEYLHNNGFTNVFVLDFAKEPLDNLIKRVSDFPKKNLLQGDFFDLNDTFDLVLEQTFFCALQPELRDKYVSKMAQILNKKGKIAGLLFQFPLTEQGSPFGGSKNEYEKRFSALFTIKTLKMAHNSIKPREEKELFAIFEKKIEVLNTQRKPMSKLIILTNQEINHKIRRIAFQIYENNASEKEIILAGIADNGFFFAKKLKTALEKISDINISLCEVKINKKQPLTEVSTSLSVEFYTNKSLVLVDDVLNSGSTLIYAIKHFLNVSLKQFKTAVLVNRNHKKFPVKADFKGISLSTSIQEHIIVEFNKTQAIAYLN